MQSSKKILLDFVGIQQKLEDELNINVDLVEYDSLKPALKEEMPVPEQAKAGRLSSGYLGECPTN